VTISQGHICCGHVVLFRSRFVEDQEGRSWTQRSVIIM